MNYMLFIIVVYLYQLLFNSHSTPIVIEKILYFIRN